MSMATRLERKCWGNDGSFMIRWRLVNRETVSQTSTYGPGQDGIRRGRKRWLGDGMMFGKASAAAFGRRPRGMSKGREEDGEGATAEFDGGNGKGGAIGRNWAQLGAMGRDGAQRVERPVKWGRQ